MEEAGKVGLSEKNCLKVDFSKKPTFDFTNLAAVFHSPEAPTAVVTWYDDVALQLYGMLGRLGKRIPEDVSIIGYGNTSYSARCFPPLTTVEERLEEVGFESVKIIKNGTSKSLMPLAVKLVERDSCAEICP
jgi:DNA-binding LacI/PurR family transcriptional regulator